jgi:hypothetical protein
LKFDDAENNDELVRPRAGGADFAVNCVGLAKYKRGPKTLNYSSRSMRVSGTRGNYVEDDVPDTADHLW